MRKRFYADTSFFIKLQLKLKNRSKRHNSASRETAFTIVELLIVIVVVGILSALTFVAYNNITGRAAESSLLSSLHSLAKKISSESIVSGVLPADKAAFLAATNLEDTDTTTYQYTLNTHVNPNVFCLTITQDQTIAHIAGNTSGAVNNPVTGPCVSYEHTGAAPDLSALECPNSTTWVKVPGSSLFSQNHFCAMKYEAKKAGNDTGSGAYNPDWVPESRASGSPWVWINQEQAMAESRTVCDGCHLITENEWLTIAHNIMSQPDNWVNGTIGSTSGAGGGLFRGHDDATPPNSLAASTDDNDGYYGTGQTSGIQRRTHTLSNGEVIWDISGNVYEHTSNVIEQNKPGLASDSSFVWRQYNVENMLWDGFSIGVPYYGTPAAATWNSLNNIGMIMTNSTHTAPVVIVRGGAWNVGTTNGVLAANLNVATPTTFSLSVGFRVAR